MRVLIVARCKNGRYAPFITEQVDSLLNAGIECQYFGVRKRGYFSQIPDFLKVIKEYKPDAIHSHYGLCGLFASFQHKVPVVTTYHGSDINNPKVLKFSKLAIKRSAFNIFVSRKNIDIAHPKGQYALIPCGINMDDYPTMSKEEARKMMGLAPTKKYILFAGSFSNHVKNPELAIKATSMVEDAELLELKGFSRQQVAALLYAVDAFLMTSHTEGSPQVIKEALACGCPIVSVDVGDVKDTINGIEGCYISERNPISVASCLKQAISFGERTTGRKRVLELGLENNIIAESIIKIYKSII